MAKIHDDAKWYVVLFRVLTVLILPIFLIVLYARFKKIHFWDAIEEIFVDK